MGKEMAAATPGNEDEIDLRELVGVLLDHKWWIVAITAVFFALSVAYVLLAPPVYRAQAMVQVEAKMPAIPGLSDLTSLSGESGAATTEIALLTSRSVVGTAVEQLHLDIVVEPNWFPLFGKAVARRFQPASPGEVAPPRLGLDSYAWVASVCRSSDSRFPKAWSVRR